MNLTIAKRLSLGLGVIIVLNIVFGLWVYQQFLDESKQVERVDHLIKSNSYWSTLVKEAALTNLGYMDAIVDKASGEVDKDIVDQREKFVEWFKGSKGDASKYLPRPEDAARWEALIPKIHEWERQGANLFADIQKQGSALDTSVYDDVLDGTTDEMIETGSAFFNELEKLSSEGLVTIDKSFKYMINVLAWVSGLIILTSVIVGGWLVRSLKRDMTRLTTNLTLIGGEVRDVASELETGSSTLDQMTSAQAAAVQETVSSMNEISAMVERSLENASNALSQSKAGVENASVGKQSVQDIVNSIQDISNSNELIMNEVTKGHDRLDTIVAIIKSIGEKSKVINDIVFQTKLLSFNASVEAARAGESGKGFAVVAEEVGNLAAMSGKAAIEIGELISSSVDKVNHIAMDSKNKISSLINQAKENVQKGGSVANECNHIFERIIHSVTSVSTSVTEISSATAEQSKGISEIKEAVRQIDDATQSNSAIANESAESAKELAYQSDSLSDVVQELIITIRGTTDQATNQDSSNIIALPKHRKKSVPSLPIKSKISHSSHPDPEDQRFKEI